MTLREELRVILPTHSNYAEKVEALIEKREEAERERVRAIILEDTPRSGWQPEYLVSRLYPPKVEKLKAGWYAVRLFGGHAYLQDYKEDFLPAKDMEYRRLENPFDKIEETVDPYQ